MDLIPEPLIIVKKNNLKFFFVNLEFQIQFGKSQSKLKDISVESIFSKSSFLISNLKRLKEKKVGMFLIKEATLFKNYSYEVRCIIPDNLNKYMLMIFLKKLKTKDKLMKTVNISFLTKHSLFSHEINNPLSSIKMASQLIKKSKNYDKELIDIISSETERISKIF